MWFGIACIMCDLESTSDTKWSSHYTVYHGKLSNAWSVQLVLFGSRMFVFPGLIHSSISCQLLVK